MKNLSDKSHARLSTLYVKRFEQFYPFDIEFRVIPYLVSNNSVLEFMKYPISSLVRTRQARAQCAKFAQTEKNYRSTKSKESFSCKSWKHFEWRNPASRVGVCGNTRWRSRSDHLGTIRLMYISALKGKISREFEEGFKDDECYC